MSSSAPTTEVATETAQADAGEVMVDARDIGKMFRLYRTRTDRAKEWASFGRKQLHEKFWALRHVDVKIRRGEFIGVIGSNGSGKTTLLRVLSSSLSHTEGTLEAIGRVYALIELSTGFNRQLTGRQNILFAAEMLGLDREYIRSRVPSIVEFADLGDFIDQPAKVYSSGMFARLGFSLFACLEPDVLMVDEALAVGDASFKKKCFERIEEMVNAEHRCGVIVSHSLPVIERLCTSVLWLHKGSVKGHGETGEVLDAFRKFYSA